MLFHIVLKIVKVGVRGVYALVSLTDVGVMLCGAHEPVYEVCNTKRNFLVVFERQYNLFIFVVIPAAHYHRFKR